MSHIQDHNGFPVYQTQEDNMDYYFVVDKTSDVIERIVQRTKGVPLTPVAGKNFIPASGVMMTFYMRLKAESDEVTLEQVKNY